MPTKAQRVSKNFIGLAYGVRGYRVSAQGEDRDFFKFIEVYRANDTMSCIDCRDYLSPFYGWHLVGAHGCASIDYTHPYTATPCPMCPMQDLPRPPCWATNSNVIKGLTTPYKYGPSSIRISKRGRYLRNASTTWGLAAVPWRYTVFNAGKCSRSRAALSSILVNDKFNTSSRGSF